MFYEKDKISAPARFLAIIPVVILAGAIVALNWGITPEGRRHMTSVWRTHTSVEHEFAVSAPGVLTVNFQPMNFDGVDVQGQTYVASDLGADFSVTAVLRPASDERPLPDVAGDLGVQDVENPYVSGPLTIFSHDATTPDGGRTMARVIFRDDMVYQVMVTGRINTFPEAEAKRFFASFRTPAP